MFSGKFYLVFLGLSEKDNIKNMRAAIANSQYSKVTAKRMYWVVKTNAQTILSVTFLLLLDNTLTMMYKIESTAPPSK